MSGHRGQGGGGKSGGAVTSAAAAEALFARCRAGDRPWSALFDLTRHDVFDFLFRLTGQRSRALETLNEAVAAIEIDVDSFTSYKALRAAMFTTARSFAADVWGADTGRLQNAAFDEEHARRTGSRRSDREECLRVDGLIRMLPGPQREALLLVRSYGMTPDEAAPIVGVDVATINARVAGALEWMSAGDSSRVAALADVVTRVPRHPMPVVSGHHTQNLSVLVQDIRAARWPRLARWLVVVMVLSAAGIGAWVFREALSGLIGKVF